MFPLQSALNAAFQYETSMNLALDYTIIDNEGVKASLVIHNRVVGHKPSFDTEMTDMLSFQPSGQHAYP